MVMSVIILLAVGSDYNLLLVARFKEEIGAGLKTGIIRAMGGTGKVVTAAGLVFAFTMASMIVSDNRAVGQVGTTIGLGLLFDTLIVRSFMTPSIAAMLGRWFWWPMNVRSRPPAPRPALSADAGFEESAETEVTAPLANGNGALNGNGSKHRHVYHGPVACCCTTDGAASALAAQRNASSMISCCSTACTFDEPDDGADMARREMRLMPVSLPGNSSGSSRPNRGHAPWLAGSSCTQKYSLTFG